MYVGSLTKSHLFPYLPVVLVDSCGSICQGFDICAAGTLNTP